MSQLPVRSNRPLPEEHAEVIWDAPHPNAGAEPDEPSPFRRLHELLRGRYLWAILLAVLLGATAVVITWRVQQPKYQSSAVIRIVPYVPKVMRDSDQSGKLPMVDAFADWQAELIRSGRVRDLAMQSDSWRELGRELTPQAKAQFAENLMVFRQERAQLIHVSFTDLEPQAAQAGVNAVIDAYMRKYGEGDLAQEAKRQRVLEEQRTRWSNEVRNIRDQILAIANEFGSDSLNQIFEFKIKQLHMLEEALKETRLSLATAPRDPQDNEQNQDGQAEDAQDESMDLTEKQIAVVDSHMRNLLDQRTQVEQRLKEVTPRHPKRPELEELRDRLQALIDEHAMAYRLMDAAAGGTSGRATTVADLRDREQRLATMYEEARVETLALGRKKLQIDRLKQELETAEQRLNEVQNRIDTLSVESSLGGRVEVVNGGGLPAEPYNTNKRAQRAVLAGFGGSALGVGMILLLGLIDRRVRSSQDPVVERGAPRLLGILPKMGKSLANADEAFDAANCVHHIRSMLQINALRHGRRVFTITSPAQGTGKSSVALGLGMSFAASRSRTLLIDGDLRGGHLSHRMRSITDKRVEQILMKRGVITPEQRDQALEQSRAQGDTFADTLVKQGALSKKRLRKELGFANGATVGLAEALEGTPLEECVSATGVDNLSVLPVGEAPLHSISNVSPAMIRKVIEQVRDQYDVVLIDTGPLAGDVVTSMLAAESDGTVLIVSRGEPRDLAERSIQILDRIGARLEGMVFNRAKPHDFQTSSHSRSLSMVSKRVRPAGGNERDFRTVVKSAAGQQAQEFGPLAQAVACTAILPRGGFAKAAGKGSDNDDASKPAAAGKGGQMSTLPLIAAALILSMIAALAYFAMQPATAQDAPTQPDTPAQHTAAEDAAGESAPVGDDRGQSTSRSAR